MHVAVLLQALKKSSEVIERKVVFMEGRTRAWSKDGPSWISTNRLREKKTRDVAIECFATDRKLKMKHLEDWDAMFALFGGWNRSSPGFMPVEALVDKMKMFVDIEYRLAIANTFRIWSEKDHGLLLGYTLSFKNMTMSFTNNLGDALDEAEVHMEQSRLAYMQVLEETQQTMIAEHTIGRACADQFKFFNDFKEKVYFQGIW